MGLNILPGRQIIRFAGRDTRRRRRCWQIGRIHRKRPGTVIGIGAGQFRGNIDIRQLVFDSLVRTDRATKGKTVPGIFSRHIEASLGATNLLERHQDRGAVKNRPRDHPALAGLSQRLGRCPGESNLRVGSGWINHLHRLAANLIAIEIY